MKGDNLKAGLIKHGADDYGEDRPGPRLIPSSTTTLEGARVTGKPVTGYEFFGRPGAYQALGDLLASDRMKAKRK